MSTSAVIARSSLSMRLSSAAMSTTSSSVLPSSSSAYSLVVRRYFNRNCYLPIMRQSNGCSSTTNSKSFYSTKIDSSLIEVYSKETIYSRMGQHFRSTRMLRTAASHNNNNKNYNYQDNLFQLNHSCRRTIHGTTYCSYDPLTSSSLFLRLSSSTNIQQKQNQKNDSFYQIQQQQVTNSLASSLTVVRRIGTRKKFKRIIVPTTDDDNTTNDLEEISSRFSNIKSESVMSRSDTDTTTVEPTVAAKDKNKRRSWMNVSFPTTDDDNTTKDSGKNSPPSPSNKESETFMSSSSIDTDMTMVEAPVTAKYKNNTRTKMEIRASTTNDDKTRKNPGKNGRPSLSRKKSETVIRSSDTDTTTVESPVTAKDKIKTRPWMRIIASTTNDDNTRTDPGQNSRPSPSSEESETVISSSDTDMTTVESPVTAKDEIKTRPWMRIIASTTNDDNTRTDPGQNSRPSPSSKESETVMSSSDTDTTMVESPLAAKDENDNSNSTTIVPQLLVERLEHPNGKLCGCVMVVTVNRTPANAIGNEMITELELLIKQIEDLYVIQSDDTAKVEPLPRCIVLKSVSSQVFSAGADLKERLSMQSLFEINLHVTQLRQLFERWYRLPIPTIGCCDGIAFGCGFEWLLACDIRIANDNNTLFALPETSLAIIPGAGGTQRLTQLIGPGRTKELIYTGRRIDGKTAEQYGLVQHVVSQPAYQQFSGMSTTTATTASEINDNELTDEMIPDRILTYEYALNMAWNIASNGPVAVRAAKFAINTGIDLMKMDEKLEIEGISYGRLLHTKDQKIGLNAFKLRQSPEYLGE